MLATLPSSSQLTLWVLLIIIIILAGWNMFAILDKSPDDTLGEVASKLIRDHPTIMFIAGVVCGHLFWY